MADSNEGAAAIDAACRDEQLAHRSNRLIGMISSFCFERIRELMVELAAVRAELATVRAERDALLERRGTNRVPEDMIA
jgi:hypothetical protein